MLYSIGKVAKMLGITSRTLRYYESVGLLAAPARTESGRRMYTEQDIETLNRILRYKRLGLSLDQIRQIIQEPDCDFRKVLVGQLNLLKGESMQRSLQYDLVLDSLLQWEHDAPCSAPSPADGDSRSAVAYLICDMQNDMVYGPLGNARIRGIIPHIQAVLQNVRGSRRARQRESKRREHIIYICDAHTAGYDKELQLWGPHAIIGTPGAEIIRELAPRAGDHVITKRTYSCFNQTKLRPLLEELNVGTLVLMGVHTNLCILHTVEDAYNWNYRVIVPRECVESESQEAQDFGLAQIQKAYNAEIVSCSCLIR